VLGGSRSTFTSWGIERRHKLKENFGCEDESTVEGRRGVRAKLLYWKEHVHGKARAERRELLIPLSRP
jgi:hypothetical protein